MPQLVVSLTFHLKTTSLLTTNNTPQEHLLSFVAQSCPTLCNPMDCSSPGFPGESPGICFRLMFIESVMLSNHLIPCHPLVLLPSIFPQHESLFQWVDQSTWASASASVLPMNIQGWFPLGRLVWFLCWPRDSQESSAPQFESISSSALSFLYCPALTSIHDYWKNHSFDYMDFCQQSMSLLFNMLSGFVISFLLRSKHLLISWLQLPSAVILEPKKIKHKSIETFKMKDL